MAIQVRRGLQADFDATKMKAGEIAVAVDEEKIYISFANGEALQIALKRDVTDSAIYYTPSVSEEGVISWTNNGDLDNPAERSIKGADGADGENGADGVSPSASVSRVTDGVLITITDAEGTTSEKLHDGYHIGSVALTSGGTGSGQTATYTMYLNDDDDDPTAAGTFEVYNGTDGTGAGDMTKAVYDTNNSGVVDNAEALGGHAPSYYATETELEDKQDKPGVLTVLPSSGTALAENTIYTIPSSAPVGTYEFVPPATGWTHGTFHTGSSVNITFATGSKFFGESPTFKASTEYEFDANGGIWAFGEVTS